MPLIGIDVETTGFSPKTAGVIQVGIAWRASHGRVCTWSEYCNPGRKYFANNRAYWAMRFNKISMETVESARSSKNVAKELLERISVIELEMESPAVFKAYNSSFDQGFLSQKPWMLPAHKWGDCVMRDAAQKLVNKKRMKLSEAMRLLEIQWPGRAHDAMHDAHAALLVHEKLREKQPSPA